MDLDFILTKIKVFLVHTLVGRPLDGLVATPLLTTAMLRLHLLIWIAANRQECVFNKGSEGSVAHRENILNYNKLYTNK